MVPDLSFAVPDFVAVEISGDDYRIPIEPSGMSRQCLIDLPNVAVFATRPDCACPDRDQAYCLMCSIIGTGLGGQVKSGQ